MPPKENILGAKKAKERIERCQKSVVGFLHFSSAAALATSIFGPRAREEKKVFGSFFGRGVKGGPPPPPPFGDWEEGRKRDPLKGLLLPFRILTAEGGEGIEGKVGKERRRWRQGKSRTREGHKFSRHP